VRLDELDRELDRVGITGARRTRILAEAADHLAESDPEAFGDPRTIAQAFADDLAATGSTRTALRAFAALSVAGLGFAAGWLLVPAAGGWGNSASAWSVPLAIVGVLGMLVCCQVSFATGLLALLQALRLRRERTVPAAEVALLLRRTRLALAFGAAAMLSLALYASVSDLAWWYSVAVGIGGVVLTVPLVAVAASERPVARIRSSVAGEAGDVFDDLPLRVPRRPWLLCFAVAGAVALAGLVAGGIDEGPRNAIVEALLVIACFAARGRGLGLRPQRRS
jgi:hypothetical protein